MNHIFYKHSGGLIEGKSFILKFQDYSITYNIPFLNFRTETVNNRDTRTRLVSEKDLKSKE